MPIAIAQSETYVGDDRWEWSVWLEGPSQELDSVKVVRYVLHPTFHNPVRDIEDRSTKFRLDTSGWGTFTINARVTFKDGHQLQLKHDLVLLYPDGTPTST